MFEEILPWNTGLKLIFVKPNRDSKTEKALLEVTNSRFVPAVVAEKDVESYTFGILSELRFTGRVGGRWRSLPGLWGTILGRSGFEFRDLLLSLFDLFSNRKQLCGVAGRSFCFLQMLQLTAPDINGSFRHPKSSVTRETDNPQSYQCREA